MPANLPPSPQSQPSIPSNNLSKLSKQLPSKFIFCSNPQIGDGQRNPRLILNLLHHTPTQVLP